MVGESGGEREEFMVREEGHEIVVGDSSVDVESAGVGRVGA